MHITAGKYHYGRRGAVAAVVARVQRVINVAEGVTEQILSARALEPLPARAHAKYNETQTRATGNIIITLRFAPTPHSSADQRPRRPPSTDGKRNHIHIPRYILLILYTHTHPVPPSRFTICSPP